MTTLALALTTPVGPADAPVLVLGPSLGTSTVLWEKTLPVLAEHYRVLTWDLPGHGASVLVGQPFTVGDLADAVVLAVGVLTDQPFCYAGVSLGGAVGLELMLRHPGAVRSAAIIASGAQLGDPAAWHERAVKVRAERTSSIVSSSAERWFSPGSVAREPELSGALLHALQDADDESYARCCEALADYDVRDRLDRIVAPILACGGSTTSSPRRPRRWSSPTASVTGARWRSPTPHICRPPNSRVTRRRHCSTSSARGDQAAPRCATVIAPRTRARPVVDSPPRAACVAAGR